GPILGVMAGCAVLLLFVGCLGAGAWYYLTQRRAAAPQPSVEYVLDASARMAQAADTGGGTRLAVAEGVLDAIIRPADPALTSGLRVFGSGKLAEACSDTDLLVPLARASQAKIALSVLAVTNGSKPEAALATAVVAALRDL